MVKQAIKFAWGLFFLAQTTIAAELMLPTTIKVPQGNTELLVLHAKGEQIYQCALKEQAYKWIVYPNAILLDAKGNRVGTHNKGPSWHYKDGSTVIGKIIQKTDEPREKAMPWLLIEATSHKGEGLLSTVSYINRVNTQGGLQPIKPCDSNHLGSEKAVQYEADYIFYTH
jgi:Protein of unknown function (DUF3455)